MEFDPAPEETDILGDGQRAVDLLIMVLGDHVPLHALDLANHDVAGPSAFQFDDELPGPVVMVKLVLKAAAREP